MSKYYLPSSIYEIVSCDDLGNFTFDLRGFRSVLDKIPNIPIVIYSVAGKYRIGKSFLLNALIPVLEHYSDNGSLNEFRKEDLDFHRHVENGFKYKGGGDSITKGIELLDTPFIIPDPNEPNKKIAILLMDCQGLNALDMKGGVDRVLFTLTNFLSSHIMYNVCGNIEPYKLLNLIALARHSKNHRKDVFCSLDIIIRDYKFQKHDIENIRKESENYICCYNGSVVERDLKEIEQYFRFVESYPLPHPGRDVEKKNFNGEKDKIDSKFIDLFYDYIFVLFNQNRTKSKFDNGEQLLGLFNRICNEIMNEKCFNVDEYYTFIEENKENVTFNKFKKEIYYPFKNYYNHNLINQSEIFVMNLKK